MTDAPSLVSDPKFQEYAHPEVLVTTEWVGEHLGDPQVRVIEADEDVLLYEVGHIPGAIKLDWHTDLQDSLRRDFVDKNAFEQLMSRNGIANDTTVVLYGDKNNWYATYTFWLFKLYGHRDVRVMDGGRLKWEQENRQWSREPASYSPTTYTATGPDLSIRAFRRDVERQLDERLPPHRRALPERIQRRAPSYGGLPTRRRPARGTHSHREEYTLGNRGEPGERHLPAGRRAARDLPAAKWNIAGSARDLLLPDRRAVLSYMVRAQVSIGIR